MTDLFQLYQVQSGVFHMYLESKTKGTFAVAWSEKN